jgi:hypothetical protein
MPAHGFAAMRAAPLPWNSITDGLKRLIYINDALRMRSWENYAFFEAG